MAKDKAACDARQVAVSRQGAGLGSRRAQGRWGAGERAGARRASLARAAGGLWVGVRARASCSWAQAGGSGAAGRWARGLGAWAGQGCALGALGLFLARFDSVFS